MSSDETIRREIPIWATFRHIDDNYCLSYQFPDLQYVGFRPILGHDSPVEKKTFCWFSHFGIITVANNAQRQVSIPPMREKH
ncbi:hypothetical protein [Rhodococcus sp. ARC_M6]|uniref:hypothetical protein n=1 Tax=Rhodococcus sp. ARC_M6 TaxID=2928852 RepID=UPI001FB52C46|nr:hypothetical protein [Rhodococcus sp. ARC_M6]MCJ0906545.1 hypothetical protein [Rhodococcus sp. ARC_M6]